MIPADRPGRWVLVRRGTALAGCLVLSACLVLPTCRVSPRAAAAPLQDAPTTQVISGTAPAPTTGTGTTSPDTVRNPGTTSPGAATSATAAGTDPAGADAALGDAVVLAEALDEGDYTALTQVVSERVAPHADGDAYATTLVDALGARGLVRVAAHLPIGTTTWTSLLATATSSPLWDEGHREALARDLASLVTTTGDVAEADTLLLPLGFRRLLTADQDPLTTAAAGTQAPGAGDGQVPGAGDTATPGPGGGQAAAQVLGAGDGRDLGASSGQSGTRGARDPLALDTGFLDALVRGLMAGETGATTGGLRVGWVEYARLTTTAGGGYSNFPGGAPREVRARYLLYDPLPAILTAAARTPAMVLDVLAPLLPGADPSTLGSSGRGNRRWEPSLWVDGSLWEWVSARAQKAGPACLEALTAALASASTLRYQATTSQPNPYEAQATWLTEQATITLADVDTTTWTPPARRATAVMLANSIGDINNVANTYDYNLLKDSFSSSLPRGWRRTQGTALRILLSEVLKDDTALAVVSWAAEVFITHRLAADAFRISSGTTIRNASYYFQYGSNKEARLYGYVYGTCAIGRGVDEGEADPAAGIMLAALDRGPDPVPAPGAPWRPPATPTQATQVAAAGDSGSLTREQLGDAIAARLRLKVAVVLDAADLIPREAYTLKDSRPAHDWITLGDDGMWHLDQEAALADPAGLDTWLNDAWTEQDLSRVTTWLTKNFDDGVLEAQDPMPATAPGAPVRHAALVVVVLSTATTLLVYSLSHTHQRRRERLRPRREERRRRWRERIRRW